MMKEKKSFNFDLENLQEQADLTKFELLNQLLKQSAELISSLFSHCTYIYQMINTLSDYFIMFSKKLSYSTVNKIEDY
jgi:hypothetical protein